MFLNPVFTRLSLLLVAGLLIGVPLLLSTTAAEAQKRQKSKTSQAKTQPKKKKPSASARVGKKSPPPTSKSSKAASTHSRPKQRAATRESRRTAHTPPAASTAAKKGSTLSTTAKPSTTKTVSAPSGDSAIAVTDTIAGAESRTTDSPITHGKRLRPKLDVIVIDPGHGGRDPGAIGPNGVKEKDVTLAIALKLGKLIEKELPGVKVAYTRRADSFVELYRRGQIANEKKAKLFISIHCNSTPKKPSNASGFETYILRPGKTDAAIKVAARENAVIEYENEKDRYTHLSEMEFILTSMARSQDVRFSEKFASLVQQEFDKELDIRNNGVAQAGFLVLVGASMPNVLIETAFLSNPDEEALLDSSQGQMKFARGLLEAIRRYKVHYEGS